MDINQETLSTFLRKLTILYANLNEFLNKFSDSLTSSASYTDVKLQDNEGNITTIKIPSYGNLKAEINALNNQFETILSANADTLKLKFKDGSVRTFEMKKMSQLVENLESIKDTSLALPNTFRIKNNWFFESFLDPLLYVNVNVLETINQNTSIDKFSVKRVILNTNVASDIDYFNNSIKDRVDLDFDTLITELKNQNIAYIIDENTVDLPVSINRVSGSFSVIKILEQDIQVSGETIVRNKYQLNKITYIDVLNTEENNVYLSSGDRLVTSDDTEYEVIDVDKTEFTVILERKFGSSGITIGSNNLRIKPNPYKTPELQINIGYDERQIIFIRPISKILDITTNKLSKGFAIHTNDLNITLSDGNEINLKDYYKSFVSDFSLTFLGNAKEKVVPAVYGLIPNTPILDESNFEVVKINEHLKEDKNIQELRTKIKTKEQIQNETYEINKMINKLKVKLNTAEKINESERLKIQKKIEGNVEKKKSLLNQVSTIISEITLGIRSDPKFAIKPQYHIRGFWEIPESREGVLGAQKVIQFKLVYRYISKKGTAMNVKQIAFSDTKGVKQIGFFSNWNETITKIRKKEYDTDIGVYKWSTEDIQDPEIININQVDIPIRKGESVEIKIKAISEAGFPINPIESEWSNVINISFPDDLEAQEEDETLAQKIFLEETSVKFQEELTAKGLDLHLLDSITTGDKYYSHKTEGIASGFYTSEGNIVNLYEKIKNLSDNIEALRTAIEKDKGVIKVTIIDPLGNITEVTNGSTISLFGGYYKDEIQEEIGDSVVYNNGEIVTNSYILSIENTSQTPLELTARLAGGIDQRIPYDTGGGVFSENMDEDYTVNRRYDLVPISVITQTDGVIGGIKHISPFQCGQVRSQFIYNRLKDYGLMNNLYKGAGTHTDGYTYRGQPVNGENIPYNGAHYLPYDPTWDGNGGNYSQHAEIWNGGTVGSPDEPGSGTGYLSEFCIHIDHPLIKALNSIPVLEDFLRPKFDVTNGTLVDTQKYLPICQALHLEISKGEKINEFNAEYFQQCDFIKPEEVIGSPPSNDNRQDNNYPVKLGFHVNDEYLVGKYTCGAYLFLGPSKYEDISIEGNHPRLAKKQVEFKKEKALNIPIVFQFRCSDKLQYIGGFRKDRSLSNVTYTKMIGVDIYEKINTSSLDPSYGDIFSFDIEVSCKYAKESPISTPINIPPEGQLEDVTFGIQ